MTDFTDNNSSSADAGSPTKLSQRLMYLFILLRYLDGRMRHDAKRGAGVFEGQGRLLRMLQMQSPIAQKQLAYLMGIRPQSLSELVNKMDRSGLVRRYPDPDDGRASLVELTDDGRDAVENLEDVFTVGETYGLNDEERTTLTGLLDKVIVHVEAEVPGGLDRRLERFRKIWLEGEGPHQHGFGPGFGMPGGPGFGGGRGRGGRGSDRGRFAGHGFGGPRDMHRGDMEHGKDGWK